MERIKFIFSSIGSFLWPLLKQFLVAAAPFVQQAAKTAVAVTAQKYAGTLVSNNDKHSDAYGQVLETLKRQGLQFSVDFTESMVDTAIAAAVKQLKQ